MRVKCVCVCFFILTNAFVGVYYKIDIVTILTNWITHLCVSRHHEIYIILLKLNFRPIWSDDDELFEFT